MANQEKTMLNSYLKKNDFEMLEELRKGLDGYSITLTTTAQTPVNPDNLSQGKYHWISQATNQPIIKISFQAILQKEGQKEKWSDSFYFTQVQNKWLFLDD